MVSAYQKKRALVTIAAFFILSTIILTWQGNQLPNRKNTALEMDVLHPDVHVIPSVPDPHLVLLHRECVDLPGSPRPGVSICLHPLSEDQYVSGALKRKMLWEANLIFQMTLALKRDPDLQLVDLGCNIGEYTLWAAALGRHVLAVDMLVTNLNLLQTSLDLSNLSSYVTLVNNALYSDHRQLQTVFLRGNMGGSRLNLTSVNLSDGVPDVNKQTVNVTAICLDDLIPLLKSRSVYLKMDIENSEHHALACADHFFKQVDVRLVQMEWLNRGHQELTQIRNFMRRHNYIPSSNALTLDPVNTRLPTIAGHDVFFMKHDTDTSSYY